jgi:hypothetical protein
MFVRRRVIVIPVLVFVGTLPARVSENTIAVGSRGR